MTVTNNEPITPPVISTDAGEARRVGVELEFSGLELDAIAELVAQQFSGCVEQISEYESLITNTPAGDFRVELDFQYLKELGRTPVTQEGLPGEFRRLSEDAVATVARHVVPMEVVTPPLRVEQLHDLDVLVDRLRAAGAKGTRHSAVYAFGLHLNPEVPSLEAGVLLRYLRAFMCLFDWLVEIEAVDWSRRVTPYIKPFPRNFIDLVLAEDYQPTCTELIDDYLLHNAERNRALDLLPLFAHIDEARVRASIDDPRIKPRPTFHYRLPNCDVDIAGWGTTTPWANWLRIERLAEDDKRLEQACAAYRSHLANPLGRLTDNWSARSQVWAR